VNSPVSIKPGRLECEIDRMQRIAALERELDELHRVEEAVSRANRDARHGSCSV